MLGQAYKCIALKESSYPAHIYQAMCLKMFASPIANLKSSITIRTLKMYLIQWFQSFFTYD